MHWRTRVGSLNLNIFRAGSVTGDVSRLNVDSNASPSRNPTLSIPRACVFLRILPDVVGFISACSGCSSRHDGVTLVVVFPDSAATEPGSPVEFNGANVGVVGDITLGDGQLTVELLLNCDTRIPHSVAPVANHQNSPNAQGSVVAFMPLSDDELSMIYVGNTTMIDSSYVDGESLLWPRLRFSAVAGMDNGG